MLRTHSAFSDTTNNMINANLARSLANDVVPVGSKPTTLTGAELRCAMTDVNKRYHIASILSPLELNQDNAVEVFTRIADNLLADGELNWGRLVALFVFAAHINKETFSDNERQAFNFTKEVGDYVASRFSSSSSSSNSNSSSIRNNFVRKAVTVFGLFALVSIMYMSR